MNKYLLNLLFCINTFTHLQATIYGKQDDRKLITQNQVKFFNKKGLYPVAFLNKQINDEGLTLKKSYNLCSGSRFENETANVICSGFFIANNLVMTANHCIKKGITSFKLALNYSTDNTKIKWFTVQKIVYQNNNADIAILKTNESISNFQSPKLINKCKNNKLYYFYSLLGHPLGMKLTLTDNGILDSYSKEKNRILAFIDSFHINSGSVVFNEVTYEIIGVLTSGQNDTITRFRVGEPVCNEYYFDNESTNYEKISPLFLIYSEIKPYL